MPVAFPPDRRFRKGQLSVASAISARSCAVSRTAPAFTQPSTCAALRAPTIAPVTPGQASVHAIAASATLIPCRAAIGRNASATRRFASRSRRVPGLRREELALLAGVSVDHYVRLEQGRTLQFSEEVLDAVSRALQLDPTEREHLYRLARPYQSQVYQGSGKREPQQVRPGLRRLLESTTDVPAYVVGLGTDVLAWNLLATALLTDFGALAPHERNLAWLVCHDEGFRALFTDPLGKMQDIAAYVRFDIGRHPDDPALGALVAELCRNPDFAEIWARHDVRDKTHGSYTYRNPVVGEITLDYETFRAPDDPDQALIMQTVPEGSPAEAALQLLAAWAQTVRTG